MQTASDTDKEAPAASPDPKDPTDGWDGRIDPEVYHKVLERRQEEERRAGKMFPGGKPFPVPDKDTDAILPDEKP